MGPGKSRVCTCPAAVGILVVSLSSWRPNRESSRARAPWNMQAPSAVLDMEQWTGQSEPFVLSGSKYTRSGALCLESQHLKGRGRGPRHPRPGRPLCVISSSQTASATRDPIRNNSPRTNKKQTNLTGMPTHDKLCFWPAEAAAVAVCLHRCP